MDSISNSESCSFEKNSVEEGGRRTTGMTSKCFWETNYYSRRQTLFLPQNKKKWVSMGSLLSISTFLSTTSLSDKGYLLFRKYRESKFSLYQRKRKKKSDNKRDEATWTHLKIWSPPLTKSCFFGLLCMTPPLFCSFKKCRKTWPEYVSYSFSFYIIFLFISESYVTCQETMTSERFVKE